VIGAVCAALYGDYLFFHSVSVSSDNRLFLEAGARKVDPNHFAAALIVPFAVALMAFLRLRFGVSKLCMLAVVCIVGSGFVTSGSRGGLMAVGAMMMYFAIRSRYRIQLLVIGALLAIVVSASPLTERFALALSTGGAGRTSIWKTAYTAFRKAWLLGSGTGNFQNAYDRAWLEVDHGRYHVWHIVAHNLIAQTAVELGIVGLVLVLFAWWMQFRSLSGTSAAAPYGDIRIALEGAIISQFITSWFLDIMWYKYTWEGFILAALARQYARSQTRAPCPADSPVSEVTAPFAQVLLRRVAPQARRLS